MRCSAGALMRSILVLRFELHGKPLRFCFSYLFFCTTLPSNVEAHAHRFNPSVKLSSFICETNLPAILSFVKPSPDPPSINHQDCMFPRLGACVAVSEELHLSFTIFLLFLLCKRYPQMVDPHFIFENKSFHVRRSMKERNNQLTCECCKGLKKFLASH